MRFSDYLFAKASKNRIPLHGTFELSPVCNFSCRMCYVRRTPEQLKSEGKKLHHWTEWLELGRQCKDAGMLYVLLTGGEPFIYPGFRQLYEALHKMGIVIMINSNGTMIDRETVEWLKTMAPSRINITLYGASSETYKRICGRPDGYNKAKEAILMIKEAGIPVVINASMIPENADDLEDIIKFGHDNGINTRIATYMFPPARRDDTDSYSRFTANEAAEMFIRKNRCKRERSDYEQMLRNMLDKMLEPFDENSEEAWGSDFEHMRCRAGRSTFWVSWEGIMTACCMLPFPIEEYPFEKPFIECWDELTETVRNVKVMQECNQCPKKEICQPCVAMIHAETGSVDKKAPYLCEMADCIIEGMKFELKELENENR